MGNTSRYSFLRGGEGRAEKSRKRKEAERNEKWGGAREIENGSLSNFIVLAFTRNGRLRGGGDYESVPFFFFDKLTESREEEREFGVENGSEQF